MCKWYVTNSHIKSLMILAGLLSSMSSCFQNTTKAKVTRLRPLASVVVPPAVTPVGEVLGQTRILQVSQGGEAALKTTASFGTKQITVGGNFQAKKTTTTSFNVKGGFSGL